MMLSVTRAMRVDRASGTERQTQAPQHRQERYIYRERERDHRAPFATLLPRAVLELRSYQTPLLGPVLHDQVDHVGVLFSRPLPNASLTFRVQRGQDVAVIYPASHHGRTAYTTRSIYPTAAREGVRMYSCAGRGHRGLDVPLAVA